MLSLFAPLNVKAIEQTSDDTYEMLDSENLELDQEDPNEVATYESIDLDQTVLKFLDSTKELHNTNKYEEAGFNYLMMLDYPSLELELIEQVEANLAASENELDFTDWVISDELIEKYSHVTLHELLDESDTSDETEVSEPEQSDELEQASDPEGTDESLELETEDASLVENETTLEDDISDVKVEDDAVETEESIIEQEKQTEEASVDSQVESEQTEEVKLMTFASSVDNTEAEKEALYQASVDGANASEAWRLALEGYNLYPDDDRFKEAIELAAVRNYTWAETLESRGNYDSALFYYNRILRAPWLSSETEAYVSNAKARTLSKATESDREALYQASVNGANASEAWSKALEGYNLYPDDDRFKEAIELAAVRNYTWAETLEGRGSYDSALFYYNRILRAPWLSSETEAYVLNAKTRAQHGESEADREAIYQASVNGANGSEAWSLALDGYAAYPDDARFKEAIELAAVRNYIWAETLEGRGSYDSALFYYNRILRAPWLSSETEAYVLNAKTRAQHGESEADREAMYQASVNGANGSEAWSLALDGYAAYPDDARFKEAIELAAVRNYTWAETLEGRGSYDSALFYYNRILRAPWLSSETEAYVLNAKTRAQHGESEADREAMYQASVNGANGSEAWSLALDGYAAYPDDARFKEAIELAAERNCSWAETLESRGSYDSALFYYNRVLSAPWLSSKTEAYVNEAVDRVNRIVEIGLLYYRAENAADTTSKLNIVMEGLAEYSEDQAFKDMVAETAEDLLNEAVTDHTNKEYAKATEKYSMIMNGPDDFYNGKDMANEYYILSKNNLNINQANYNFSYYKTSLDEALDAQMKRAPQTDVNRQWINASSDQVKYYLNPENFVNGLDYELVASQSLGRVNTSALNVRSGSSTSHTTIDMIYNGQQVNIHGTENGWFNISYSKNNQIVNGWVSSMFITVESNVSETKNMTDAYHPIAQIDVATLNVRTGPTTLHQIIATVSRDSKYRILKESNGWYQVQLSNTQLGWLHGDFVTVSNSLNRNLMQFLKLSGTSGIKAAELNEELKNSGVLTNTGQIFIEASKRYNINENYLMAHAKLETGHGTSKLATGVLVSEVDGKAVTPKVVYNMYGIAAFDNSALKLGSEYAYKQGWDTIDKSILGGAEWISRQYVNHSTHQRDTLYKMRWNPGSPGNHQYATDIGWAIKQTSSLNSVVELSQKYNIPLHFDIAVYRQ
ncbi:SH3 domain-containing protein [Alkalibacterium sp. 20]|uniref:SH3 domain-containing protein n=1 Tax=Alkalibacterium sp. 20 TaxID=1798803 RepID=UPI0009002388|nr:SH3 domain-containing protein [Alkalibacterium sp. 20]OJF91859.1 hypothetical protein AX762_10485 [Alkalibacterium sp. 20]